MYVNALRGTIKCVDKDGNDKRENFNEFIQKYNERAHEIARIDITPFSFYSKED